jgi:DNA-binding helix-hairpin-helix protein with protein kinase domain
MSHESWRDGKLVLRADDSTRTVTEWDAEGKETSRPYTAEENAAADARAVQATEEANEVDLRSRVRTALQANADYLALSAPTAAQSTAQVKSLTRQATALIRLVTRELRSTDGA